MLPDVSVVMSVHNGEVRLPVTLDAILSQEDVSLEVLVVDDGSSDGSLKILRGYAARDPRVKILEQSHQGLTRSLIRGCACATADYVARHDVGDRSSPQRLALQKKALDEHPEVAFVSCWTEFRGPRDEFLYTAKGTGLPIAPTTILAPDRDHGILGGPTCHPSVTFRRSAYTAVGGYREAFYLGQDWDLWYRLAAVGQFWIVPETLYYYVVAPDSLSIRYRGIQRKFSRLSLQATRLRARGLPDDSILRRAPALATRPLPSSRRSHARGHYFVASCLLRNRDPRAVHYLRQSLKADPLFWRAWLRLVEARLLARRF
jgi:glycosyltransferase involved in cell wall biosynthesis